LSHEEVVSRSTSDLASLAEAEPSGGGAAVATLPLPLARERERAPALRDGDERGRLLRRLLLTADLAALSGAFLATGVAFGTFQSLDVSLLVLSIPLWVLLAYGHRLYHFDGHRADYRASDEIGPVLQMATLWSWIVLLALSMFRPEHVEVPRVAVFWAVTVLLLLGFRSGMRAFARRRIWYRQNALVVGPPAQVAALVRKILRHPEWGITPAACVDFAGMSRFPPRTKPPFDLVPMLHGQTDLPALVAELDIDRVMLAPAVSESDERLELVCELAELGVHVDLIPGWSDVVGARLDLHQMEGTPMLTVPRADLSGPSFLLKRALDLLVGSMALVVLAPLFAACALAIKLDSPGPALFRQRRVGRDDKRFEVFKFRSMYEEADDEKHRVADLNLHGGGTQTGMFKIREDPRITRVGRFLRRHSIDELPQLLNILRGEMSLVGPRPLIENEDRQVEGRFRRRLGLTPGLTGLWQAHGRSEIPFEEMVSLDYLYVTNWSLWGDVKLLMRTFSAVLGGRGAY
jgi:exopolysaccharide biosynthesis polyprenyl glycosylphosphotransferase